MKEKMKISKEKNITIETLRMEKGNTDYCNGYCQFLIPSGTCALYSKELERNFNKWAWVRCRSCKKEFKAEK